MFTYWRSFNRKIEAMNFEARLDLDNRGDTKMTTDPKTLITTVKLIRYRPLSDLAVADLKLNRLHNN